VVETYTDRAITAIISLESEFVAWPGDEERKQISQRIRAASGFPSCLGFIDGTLFPLAEKPGKDGEDYYSRKGSYGLAGLIVCDDQKRIRHVYTGWPGCAHDARVFENSQLALQTNQFFMGNQYLLADSGYTPSSTIIPCFKKLPNQGLLQDRKRFNSKVAHVRINVEHCIGILKARFQSLKGLRLRISKKRHLQRCILWIRACCVLHNFLLSDPIDEDWLEDGDVSAETEEEVGQQVGGNELGVDKRQRLMDIVLFE
jgi:hypothetical protein